MCGIAGFLSNGFADLSVDDLLRMGDSIAHRGPDAHGEFLDTDVGLCHRRLSILDLSAAGNQPMYSADQNIIIIFNGEIYNFVERRDELIKNGIEFSSGTDTEVIIQLYLKHGRECLKYLNGMFAFAIWDKRDKTLFIARDRLGKKPLYYFDDGKRFAFASEIKALLELPDIPREVRLDAVYDFFAYQYVPDPKSIFKQIYKLPPGHFMVVDNGVIAITKYWDLDITTVTSDSESTSTQKLRDLLKSATKRRMLSDVPLGAFLSGGVDSSGVVATMAKMSSKAVKTCTVAFDDEKFNESEFAKSVAEQYNTEHHEFLVNQNVSEQLEHIVSFFDEPFADPSLVPTYFVSELARQAVTVAIAGDGGDEVFAGYEKYTKEDIENRLRQKFPQWMRKRVFPTLADFFALSELPLFRKAKSLLTSLSVSPEYGFYITNSQIDDRHWRELSKQSLKDALADYHPSKITLDVYKGANGPNHLANILYTDIKTYLTGGILVKVDRMSMANSLEVRAPILDMEILEFAATLPHHFKFKDGEKKHILKEAFKPDLSDDVLYRKKMGFSVPLAEWFRTEIYEIAEKYLIADPRGLSEVFELQAIKKYWQDHQDKKADHSTILWSMLMYEMWWQRYMKIG